MDHVLVANLAVRARLRKQLYLDIVKATRVDHTVPRCLTVYVNHLDLFEGFECPFEVLSRCELLTW